MKIQTRNTLLLSLWLALSAVGTILVIPKDSAEPILRLSGTHGPSTADMLGIALILFGAGAQWTYIITNVKRLISVTQRNVAIAASISFVLGILLIAWSVLSDTGNWWMVGIGLITLIFVWFIATVEKSVR